MKRIVICLGFLFISAAGLAQDISITKSYDFGEALIESQNNDYTFTIFSLDLSKSEHLMAFTSTVVFPLVEKRRLLFEAPREERYSPIISLDNLYQSIPKFINFAPHLQQPQGGRMKILKGYDLCLRPIY